MSQDLISTSRLRLRTPLASDLLVLHERVFSDAVVMQFVLGGQPLTLERTAEFFQSAFDHERCGLKLGVLVEKGSEEVVGFAGLMECDALGLKEYEVGFVLSRFAWGKGYATEIGLAQLTYGFERVGCARILAQVAPENSRSVKALEKVGMTFHSSVVTHGRGIRHVYVALRPSSLAP